MWSKTSVGAEFVVFFPNCSVVKCSGQSVATNLLVANFKKHTAKYNALCHRMGVTEVWLGGVYGNAVGPVSLNIRPSLIEHSHATLRLRISAYKIYLYTRTA